MKNVLSSRLFLVVAALLAVAAASHFGLIHHSIGLDGYSLIGVGMAQMTPASARVVDPVLSRIAQGYKNNDFVGMNLFPSVPVQQRGGKIIVFGTEDFNIYNNLLRAPGSNTKRMQISYSSTSFALDQYS